METQQLDLNALKCLCKISVCPPEESTDFEKLGSTGMDGGTNAAERFIIEFGTQNPSILVSVGQKIGINDVIATMKGIPVKSKVAGTITEKTDKYIIGEYETDCESILSSIGLSSDMTEEDLRNKLESTESSFDALNNILKEDANVSSFIKDYILRFRFADLALNSIEFVNYALPWTFGTTDSMVEKYGKDSDKIIEKYNDKVKDICSSTNIKSKCEANNMMAIKNDLDAAKKKYFSKIIAQYNKTGSYGNNSGKISEYMLYDMYSEYINSDDFVYDENNPYVVELYYHITTFMQIRERLEYNGSNIDALLANFRSLCDETIRKYWDDTEYDYYGKMKEIFRYDFYAHGSDDTGASLKDAGRDTLYKKVLDYLKNLTKYVQPKSSEEKYKDMDVDSIINGGEVEDSDEDKAMMELEKKLKKIAISFVQLKRVETEMDQNYFSEYIPDDDTNDIFTLKDQIGAMSLKEYVSTYTTLISAPPTPETAAAITAVVAAMQKYIDPLLRLTRNESRILRDLSDRAIAWYLDHGEDIRSGKIFESMMEISWPNSSAVYKDTMKHDFFYLEEPKTLEEQLNDPMANGGEISNTDENGYVFTEDSMKTQMDIFSLGYWLKYCAMATLVNCMLPMYWSTGLIIAGAPIKLPIIYLPLIVIPGRVTIVIGLGICGICPLPMILFVNYSDTDASIIPIINIVIDLLQKIPPLMMKLGEMPVKGIIKGLIEAQDTAINQLEQKKTQIGMQIQNLKNGVDTDKEVLANLKIMRGDDPTTNSAKKAD